MPEWKPVVGFEKYYEVSNEGQIRRTAPGLHGGTRPGLVLKHRIDKKGYHSVMACVEGKTSVISIHRAVLEAFVGPGPMCGEGNHENGNKNDCSLSNLNWKTSSGNKIHMYQTGLRKRKLSDIDVENIKTQYATGEFSQVALAKKHGVSQVLISSILRGMSYRFKLK